MNFKEIIEIAIYAVLSIFGVAARELRYKNIKHVKTARLLSSMVVATFGATIVYFIASMTNLPLQMGYIFAGLIGWGGPEIIDKIFEKQTGIKPEHTEESAETPKADNNADKGGENKADSETADVSNKTDKDKTNKTNSETDKGETNKADSDSAEVNNDAHKGGANIVIEDKEVTDDSHKINADGEQHHILNEEHYRQEHHIFNEEHYRQEHHIFNEEHYREEHHHILNEEHYRQEHHILNEEHYREAHHHILNEEHYREEPYHILNEEPHSLLEEEQFHILD